MIITTASPADAGRLFAVWDAAVRATHHFLSEHDLATLAPIVRDILQTFTPIHCLRGEDGQPYAFMGVADGSIEMLFVDPVRRGGGAGRTLVQFAMRELGACRVDVNEQNEQACGFYRHLGFAQVGRSPNDPFGNPFPILHLALPHPAG